ncbi:hypothetical protein EDC96DRAFT_539129 [Choanephora cucurbitarum]|nr:hypothetical protein EDC96DRAFT_539129 [Choanephora cucurbitarum]
MDQLARNFLDNVARLVRDGETENTSEIAETVVASSESVAIDITEPFSLNALIDFSEINGNPKGFERLSESGYVDIHWAKRESKTMSNDDLQCLKAYYERQYAVPITVQNHIEKFKEIKVLGYVYKSKLHGEKTAAAFNAYRCNDVETDDLEGVEMDHCQEHLRAGSVKYFFKHTAEFVSDYNIHEELDHYFAFVEWFKNPRKGKETHDMLTDDFMRPFRDEVEKKGSYSIMPVQKFYTPIHIQKTSFTNIIVTADFPRRII